jgi:excinuclease ABC subunit B
MIGINLLREGLDLPEVSLVVVLDADKEGFLRNTTSLIQTFGRAARNIHGSVIMYSDNITKSMEQAMVETRRRRQKQIHFNKERGIVPRTIVKPISKRAEQSDLEVEIKSMPESDLRKLAINIEANMKRYAEDLDFEKAIELRNQLSRINKALDHKIK